MTMVGGSLSLSVFEDDDDSSSSTTIISKTKEVFSLLFVFQSSNDVFRIEFCVAPWRRDVSKREREREREKKSFRFFVRKSLSLSLSVSRTRR